MKPTWLIEAEVFPNEDAPLVAELVKQDIPHVVTKFGKSYEDYIEALSKKPLNWSSPVIFHGSLQFGALIFRKTNWAGYYCNLPKFECQYYYPRFGSVLLNSDYVMLPFGELNRRKDWLFNNLGDKEGKIFIRPSSGFKTFTGAVAGMHSWEEDYRRFCFYGVDPEALVVVAPTKEIKKEWRAVVVDKKIIAASQYKAGENGIDESLTHPAIQYAQKVVNEVDYQPDPVWTIDVCEAIVWEDFHGYSTDYRVVETGSFSCAGLYACNPEAIVTEVNKITLIEWENQK